MYRGTRRAHLSPQVRPSQISLALQPRGTPFISLEPLSIKTLFCAPDHLVCTSPHQFKPISPDIRFYGLYGPPAARPKLLSFCEFSATGTFLCVFAFWFVFGSSCPVVRSDSNSRLSTVPPQRHLGSATERTVLNQTPFRQQYSLPSALPQGWENFNTICQCPFVFLAILDFAEATARQLQTFTQTSFKTGRADHGQRQCFSPTQAQHRPDPLNEP